ncbi:PAS domain S-box protein [Entomomonas asaccharolytica]|uniref:Sensor protein FixL n=1 Tax=Entomomonas asaccharolytica TaxID=2785331 RepID=A0A974NGV4_9GAMM|nr:PAS domain S-box protein [Entomomonas asaccharolytica]QQP86428.1 PAS domain S-box protein [Entomomonas asaccharolytica]
MYHSIFYTLFSIVSIILFITVLLYYRNILKRAREDQSRLEAIVNTAVDGIITINENGLIQSFNKSAERIFGWSAEEVIGRNVNILMNNHDQQNHDQYLQHYQKTKTAKIIGSGRELIAVKKDGTSFPIRLTLGEAKLSDHSIYVSIVIDMTQRKIMENALRESEQQFRSLVTNIPGIAFRITANLERKAVFISEGITKLTGLKMEDITSGKRSYLEVIKPEFMPLLDETLLKVIETKKPYTIEYQITHLDGRDIWVWESCVYVSNGDQQWIDGVIFDITDRHLIEDQIRNSRDMAEKNAANTLEFLANISHEIRTPLNAVFGFTHLLAETPLNSIQKHYMESVTSAANSLFSLINNVLDVMKLDRSAMELENIDFSLKALLEDCVTLFRLSAQTKNLKLTLNYSPTLKTFFKGDPLRIRQIITNIVANAIKFTKQGEVSINAFMDQNKVHIAIKDTGIGISPSNLEKIFMPFTQEDASMSRHFGGTGLGTTIAKQLTELMQGEITVESKLNVGTTFHIILPLQEGIYTAPKDKEIQQELPSLTILAVDDISYNLELLEIILKKEGHTVISKTNGFDAIEAFKTNHFDLVFMDIQMPDLDGIETTRIIREYEHTQNLKPTPILAFTANVLARERQNARAVGMNGFVKKPFDAHDIKNAIATVYFNGSLNEYFTNDHHISIETSLLLIDWTRAISLWNDKDHLIKIIYNFLIAIQQELSTFELTTQNTDLFFNIMHKAKGASGNLCLSKLYKCILKIEQHKNPLDIHQLNTLLKSFLEITEETLREVIPLLPTTEQPTKSPVNITSIDDKTLISEISTNLTLGKMDDSQIQSVFDILTAHHQYQVLSQLKELLDKFELTNASFLLKNLIK